MEKGLKKLEEFNYIYKLFKIFSASNPFVACILTTKQNIDFSDDRISCACIIRIPLIFYNMKVCCVFSLESPH